MNSSLSNAIYVGQGDPGYLTCRQTLSIDGFLERQGPGANYMTSGTHFFADANRTQIVWLLRGSAYADISGYEGRNVRVYGCLVPGANNEGPGTTGFLEISRIQ